MPDADISQSNGSVEFGQSLSHTRLTDNVVARNVSMASVNARADRDHITQIMEHLGHLFKTAAQRILGASSVFDQDGQSAFSQIELVCCCGDCGSRLP